MAEAFVNPAMLAWARARAGMTHAGVLAKATKTQKKWVAHLPAWETGASRPTFEQARTLARLLGVPLGYLFLLEPPTEEVTLPDLRTVGNRSHRFSLDLIDVVADALRKQAWLREYREEHGLAPVDFVGKSKVSDDPGVVASRLTKAL